LANGQAGFRTDWERGTRDTFTFQGDVYREIAGETTTYALYSPPSQVTVDANAQLTGGNLLARWKRVLNDRSDFQVQAYFDRTITSSLNSERLGTRSTSTSSII